ncbi:hypothetical protein C0991_001055 [Blastosporella zonata]|nr:hypothetical protein C0991_001055 [Blastosporella zonata]
MLEDKDFSSMLSRSVTHLHLPIDKHIPYFARTIPELSPHIAPRSLSICIENMMEDNDDFDWEHWALGIRPHIKKDQSVLLGHFPTIVSLDLSINCDTLLEVIQMITSFPLLENITLDAGGPWKEEFQESETDDLSSLLKFQKAIRSLSLSPHQPHFIQWFLQCRPLQTPSRLELDIDGNAVHHGQLLRQAGPCLTHLKIKAMWSFGLLSEHVSLEENRNLRSFHIIAWDNPVQIVLRLLSQLPGSPTALEQVEFQAWQAGSDYAEMDRLTKLDLLLTGSRFAELRKVTVSVFKADKAAVEERLAGINSRKILRLFCHDQG